MAFEGYCSKEPRAGRNWMSCCALEQLPMHELIHLFCHLPCKLHASRIPNAALEMRKKYTHIKKKNQSFLYLMCIEHLKTVNLNCFRSSY